MAATTHIPRRGFLKAIPAAGAALAVPAMAGAEGESPLRALYREWRDFSSWVNSPATKGITDEEFDRLTDVLNEHVARVVAAPSQSHLDTIIKFHVVVADYQFFNGIEDLEPLGDEARALVEAFV